MRTDSKPTFDWDDVLSRTHEPDSTGRHGTLKIKPAKVKPPLTLKERILFAVNKAAEKHRREGLHPRDVLTREQRKEIADQYRKTANRIERAD